MRSLESVSSTMDEAQALLDCVAVDSPGLVLAKRQTKGRGRQGREWKESEGALYMTLVFENPLGLAALSGFSLAVGCAIIEALKTFGAALCLKWPNDILAADGRKLAGVLIESAKKDERNFVLVGIGMNLKSNPGDFAAAVCLSELCLQKAAAVSEDALSTQNVAAIVAESVYGVWRKFIGSGGFSQFKSEWLAAAMYLGQKLSVESSGRILTGTFVGIDDNGCMLLEVSGKVEKIVSGHVGGR